MIHRGGFNLILNYKLTNDVRWREHVEETHGERENGSRPVPILLAIPRRSPQCAAARLYYLSAALIDVDERTSRLPSGLRSATRYWMPRSAHWVRLISLSPSSFTK